MSVIETLKDARESFIYKISNRDTSQYSGLTLDSVVTKEEAIKMYRVLPELANLELRAL